jgi:23S rRNA (pseudouridine1915-N3)-methyltransferase
MKCTVLAVGRLRPPYADDVEHYAKLLSRAVKLELVEVRDDEQVARRIDERAFVVALDAGGAQYGSEQFAAWIEERRQAGRDVVFVIGGAFGLPPLDRVDHKLSLGRMTVPHQLARVILLEQLYRAHKILANEPYHY